MTFTHILLAQGVTDISARSHRRPSQLLTLVLLVEVMTARSVIVAC